MSTIWSMIVNRKDKLLQSFWTEWRAKIVTTSPGPGDPNPIVIPMLDNSTGQLDPSLIPGGGGGGGNFVQAEVDFGFASANEGDIARTTVTGQTWVTGSSIIVCDPAALATADHDPDDAVIEGLVAYAENIVPGTGFDIIVIAPQNSWGRYLVNASGQ
jgi:hypothetical protein